MPALSDFRKRFQTVLENGITKKLLLALPLIAGFLLITDFVIISILAAASIILPIFLNYLGIKMLGIELVTLTTVLTALQIGSEAGAIAGLVLMTGHMVAGQYSGAYLLWVIPSYAVAGFAAGTMGLSVTTIGIGITFVLNTLFTTITYFVSPQGLSKQIPHALGNITLNSVFFLYVAPQLLAMM